MAYIISYVMPAIAWLARLFFPSLAVPVLIPTRFLRGVFFKLMSGTYRLYIIPEEGHWAKAKT